MIEAIAATGDAGDINCWSGIPHYFGKAAAARGERAAPWRLTMKTFSAGRRRWNLAQFLRGRGTGGYQYSRAFLDPAEAAIPRPFWQGRVLTFNQHFPRGQSVAARGGHLVHYVDATFASFCTPGGLAETLPRRVQADAKALERENYAVSERIVTMARWAAESVCQDCGVPAAKVAVILPGANLELPDGYAFPARAGRPGLDRPLTLGFVGKDWKRKGLPFLLEVRTELEKLGLSSLVRCAGRCPPELQRTRGLEYAGFIDKAADSSRFLQFLSGCDVGCLFSEREPLGISTLEFLRAGVPVAGFTVEGVADTVPPDAGFRFEAGTTAATVAHAFASAFGNTDTTHRLRAAARAWSPLVTWERCVAEWQELLATGSIKNPVRPWESIPAAKDGGETAGIRSGHSPRVANAASILP
ncbi:MAG TPA: glycosyltransferase family 4 protein [Opitutaceae bacterium]|nr:glycosyltransferase family 4 protein [Opitutaceae bacterium]